MTTECVRDVYQRIAGLALGKPDEEVTETEYNKARTAVGQTIYAEDPDIEHLLRYFHGVPKESIEDMRSLLYCVLRKDLTIVGEKFVHGTYQHFKGGRYVTLVRAKDAISGIWTILYMSLLDGTIWVRDEIDFSAVVKWPDGKHRSRFVRSEVVPTSGVHINL